MTGEVPVTGDVPAPGDAWARVRRVLLAGGATEEEIERARRHDVVDLLTVDRLLVPADRRYTADEVALATGV